MTNDIEKRLVTHSQGKGSKYVRAHLPFKLVYSEQFDSKIDALKREYEVKQWSRQKKMRELKIEAFLLTENS
jgi:putative endonuclease